MNYFIFGILFMFIFSICKYILSILANITQYINAAIVSKTRKDFTELFEIEQEEEHNHNPIGFSTEVIGFDIDIDDYDDEEQ